MLARGASMALSTDSALGRGGGRQWFRQFGLQRQLRRSPERRRRRRRSPARQQRRRSPGTLPPSKAGTQLCAKSTFDAFFAFFAFFAFEQGLETIFAGLRCLATD
eukprot:COSAG04_NODE_517_length_13186_cov_7.434248_17_plen_105_part_00